MSRRVPDPRPCPLPTERFLKAAAMETRAPTGRQAAQPGGIGVGRVWGEARRLTAWLGSLAG